MSVQKIAALIVIFIGTSIAWIILGSSNLIRTETASSSLKYGMQSMYGDKLVIDSPTVYAKVAQEEADIVFKEDYNEEVRIIPLETKETTETVTQYARLDSSDIKIDVVLDRRKKGYLWFPTFRTHFSATYHFSMEDFDDGTPLYLSTMFASNENIYTNVKVNINGEDVENFIKLLTDKKLSIRPDKDGKVLLKVEYDATGMEELQYNMAPNRNDLIQVNNFNCQINTDFTDYDFPRTMLSPTTKEDEGGKARLNWTFSNIITGKNIGLIIPNKQNAGYITSRVSFFAPVSLLFFFIVLLMISAVSKQNIHPMHFFFLALSFFSFHLMFSYFSYQMHIYLIFSIVCIVSLGLTVSYVMHFLSKKMAFVIVPLTQIIYLFVFSVSFFFDGITGLIVTICAVSTLFILMQLTAKHDWHSVFNPTKAETSTK